jgi:ABC-type transporter Mla subunit MlaD
VGWFVFLATLLLIAGFAYYLYHAAERKGWFLIKARFYTYVNKADGINVGDPVTLMGFQVGEVTDIAAMPPRTQHNVRIDFVINQMNRSGATPVPYYSYVWNQGSVVKLNSSDFLGKRSLEVTRGSSGFGIYSTRVPKTLSLEAAHGLTDPGQWRLGQNLFDSNSNLLFRAWTTTLDESNLTRFADLKIDSLVVFHTAENAQHIAAVWNEDGQRYLPYNHRNLDETNAYELPVAEAPAISDQLQAIVAEVQQAVPNVLALTNKLAAVLDNAANATSNLNLTIAGTQPLVKNFTAISTELRGPGALGEWVLGSNAPLQVATALTNANTLLVGVDTNLNALTEQMGLTLENLANITSNLNAQVQANSNMLWSISKSVRDTDDLVQGLKRHWLLRSAFKKKY